MLLCNAMLTFHHFNLLIFKRTCWALRKVVASRTTVALSLRESPSYLARPNNTWDKVLWSDQVLGQRSKAKAKWSKRNLKLLEELCLSSSPSSRWFSSLVSWAWPAGHPSTTSARPRQIMSLVNFYLTWLLTVFTNLRISRSKSQAKSGFYTQRTSEDFAADWNQFMCNMHVLIDEISLGGRPPPSVRFKPWLLRSGKKDGRVGR